MHRLSALAATVVLGIIGLTLPAGAGDSATALPAGARCSSGSLSDAATAVFGAGAEVVHRETIAGLDGALVLEPRIAPGTRARLLRVGDRWCEASSGFNLAWAAADRSFEDGGSVAAAYARIAAVAYFDSVRVTGVDPTAPGIFTIRTHARTNGVDARWIVATDGSGVRSARWTATAFAQPPFVPEIEGLTAFPGGSETYIRVAGGVLEAARGLPTAADARLEAPSLAEYVSPDDFHIAVSVGDSHVAIDPGMDTGVRKADVVRETLAAIKINYEDFYAWGLRKGWGELEPVSGPNKGYVYINDALSLYCFACVFIADDFQIHMLSEVEAVLGALGYTYPDGVKAWQDVIGHEMFHNFQNRYVKPGPLGRSAGRGVTTAYSEGTARAQEAMHLYSDVSYQPNSLIYANDGNGCNGYNGSSFNAAMASGPFNKGYTACFFWLSWIAAEGVEGLQRLVSTAYPSMSPEANGDVEGVGALAQASPRTVEEQLARFAGAALTGRGYELAAPTGGPIRDWAEGLDRWAPSTLSPGDSATVSLANSGMFARRISDPSTVLVSDSSAATLFIVVDDGESTTTQAVQGDSVCVAPEPGERIWVGAVRTQAGSSSVSLTTAQPNCP